MMKRRTILGLLMLLFVLTDAEWGWAQGFRPGMGSFPAGGNMMQQMGTRKSKADSLQKRDLYADSITIFYKSFDSTRNRAMDSSINDFTTRFPMPYTHYHLGNFGHGCQVYVVQPIDENGL